MNADLLQGFYLGDLLVEPPQGRITSREGTVHLPPKAIEILLCLADRPGELVTRGTLLEEVWGSNRGSTKALSHAIGEIRHALNDHRSDPKFIETLQKRGYRLLVTPVLADTDTSTIVIGAQTGVTDLGLFEDLKQRGVLETGLAYLIVGWLLIQVADIVFEQLLLPQWAGTFVTVFVIAGFPLAILLSWFLEFRDGRAVVHKLSQADARKRRFSRTYMSVITALGVAAVAVFFYDKSVGLPEAEVAPVDEAEIERFLPPVLENSIAVLPFLNIDGSDTSQIFSDGLGEDVLDRLAKVPGLLVSSRGDSWSLPPSTSSDVVRRRLRVAFFVEGSVRLVDDQLRIVVQLIDSENGFHIMSRSFERELADFMGLQREVTSLIVANLRIVLPEDSQSLIASSGDDTNLDAYVLYRRGVDMLHRPNTGKTLDMAIGFFEQALKVDSEYPAAHAGLCQAFVASYDLGSDSQFIVPAESACSAALAANSKLDIVYTALGDLYLSTGSYEEGQTAYSRALDINAQSVPAMHGLSVIYENQGRLDEAEALLQEAIRLQPGNWRSMNSLGGFLFANGRYDEAADAYRAIASLDPNNWQGLGNLGSALLMTGNFEDAATALQRSIEIEQDRSNLSNLAIIYYYLGRFDESVAIHRESVDLFPESDFAWLNLADSLSFSSESGQAEAAYQKAAELSEKKLAIDPRDSTTLCNAAWATAMSSDTDRAADYMRRAIESAPSNPYVHYYDALLKTKSADYDAALDALSVALVNGYPRVMLVSEPLLADIRDTERFAALITVPKRENDRGVE